MATEFVIEHQSTFVIRCSFCKNHIRKVVPNYADDDSRNARKQEQTKKDAKDRAITDGWRSAKTEHGTNLNYCPDHVSFGKEMGVLI